MLGQPWARILYGGKDITGDISSGLLSIDWTDNLHGKADELAVKLEDRLGLWRGPWRPEKGDEVQAFMGRSGDGEIDCGLFTVDIPDAGGNRSGGDWLSFKAVSAPHTQALRTQRSDFDEETDLKKIITKRAGRNELSVAGTIDPVAFKYKRQRRERDLAFIRRTAEDYNHFVSIKSRQLVFFPRQQLESANAVTVFELADLAIGTDWSAREQEHGTYSKAKSRYLDPDKKEMVEAETSDGRVTNGDELIIDERVENEGQAKKLAEGRLAKANEDWRTAQITAIGKPWLIAGNVVELGSTFGKYAGRYLIHVATHSVKRGSWTVKLDLKGVK